MRTKWAAALHAPRKSGRGRFSRGLSGSRLSRGAGAADVFHIATSPSSKRLTIRRAGSCSACGLQLAVGEEALWNRTERSLTCLSCGSPPPAVIDGRAGASAQREYERRHAAREQRARERLGGFGVLLSRLIEEPQSIRAWQQGARGEVRSAERFAKQLDDHNARLLHDRRVPGHGMANIDHIAIGPAGVLVIDSKTHRGRVRTEWVGGLLAPRRQILLIDGRDQTPLIDGVERQVDYVRDALGSVDEEEAVLVRGVLCFPNPDGLPLLSQLSVRGIVIDGPKPIQDSPANPERCSRTRSRRSGSDSVKHSRQHKLAT